MPSAPLISCRLQSCIPLAFVQAEIKQFENTTLESRTEQFYDLQAQPILSEPEFFKIIGLLYWGIDMGLAPNGYTPLHEVVANGYHPHVLHALVTLGTNIDLPSHEEAESPHSSPLQLAILNQNYSMMQILVSGGANLDSADRLGRMPLASAISNKDVMAVHILLAGGACLLTKHLNFTPPKIFSALEYAERTYAQPDIIRLLKLIPLLTESISPRLMNCTEKDIFHALCTGEINQLFLSARKKLSDHEIETLKTLPLTSTEERLVLKMIFFKMIEDNKYHHLSLYDALPSRHFPTITEEIQRQIEDISSEIKHRLIDKVLTTLIPDFQKKVCDRVSEIRCSPFKKLSDLNESNEFNWKFHLLKEAFPKEAKELTAKIIEEINRAQDQIIDAAFQKLTAEPQTSLIQYAVSYTQWASQKTIDCLEAHTPLELLNPALFIRRGGPKI